MCIRGCLASSNLQRNYNSRKHILCKYFFHNYLFHSSLTQTQPKHAVNKVYY